MGPSHILQRSATHCSTLQHTHHTQSPLAYWRLFSHCLGYGKWHHLTHCNTLQHIATYCDTMQQPATHCFHTATQIKHTISASILAAVFTLPWTQPMGPFHSLQHTTTHCNTLQHTHHTQSPLAYWRLFSHCLGHGSWDHLSHNLVNLLLVFFFFHFFPPPPFHPSHNVLNISWSFCGCL